MGSRKFYAWPTIILRALIALHFIIPTTALRARLEMMHREVES